MLRLLVCLIFSIATTLAHANDLQDADKAWVDGKPWPAHWGLINYPYKEGWNVVILAYVHKVYDKGDASSTWLKEIPFAMQKGAAVEVCVMKRGLLRLATICKDALVYPDMVGTLKEDDVVAIFYPNHKTTIFADGPGANPRAAVRVFQKITDAGDESCWQRRELLFYGPIAKECFNKIDTARIENILTRDFGPKTGSGTESLAGPVENVWSMDSKRTPVAAAPEAVTAKAATEATVDPASENKGTY